MFQAVREHSIMGEQVLYMAMELSKNTWRLAFSVGAERRIRQVTVPARDLSKAAEAIKKAKQKYKLSGGTAVRSCYEAGLDGFWIHRWLESLVVSNLVVDPASIQVSRQKRRAKTDRLDAQALVRQLVRYHQGEREVWSVVRVPAIESEDQRCPHRDLSRLKRERSRVSNRIWSALMGQGVCDFGIGRDFIVRLDSVELWNGAPLPVELKKQLLRHYAQYQLLESQIAEIIAERQASLAEPQTATAEIASRLLMLRAIGPNSAWVFSSEFFSWRNFRNGKEVGRLSGLTGTPYASGDSQREQGISKAGNWRVRTMAVEVAWCWLRWQPQSKLSQWFKERFGSGGKRMRRIGIVALARKLLVALWRFVEFGEVPEGAVLTST